MKRQLTIALLLVAAACSGVPARDYAAYSDAYTRGVQSLTALRAAGKIDDASYREITPAVHAGDAAFDSWRAVLAATPPDQKPDVPASVVNAVLDVLDTIAIWQAKLAEGSK